MAEITQILDAVDQGDTHAAEQLLPLVYDELRQLAARRLSREKPGQTLQATALVHEAYVRLVEPADQRWENRRHFFAAASEAMRRILVENARRKLRVKHGGQRTRVDLSDSDQITYENTDELLEIDEALDRLAKEDRTAAELVKLRYFAGMTGGEAAAALGISVRTATRLWAYARAWLRDAVPETDEPS